MAHFPRPPGSPRAPRGRRADAEEFQPGRVFAVFGAKGAGKSFLCRLVHNDTDTPTGLIASNDTSNVGTEVAKLRSAGTEVIFLDGLPESAEHVQWLWDERLIAPGFGGAIIRVARHSIFAPEFDQRLTHIEERIRTLSIPYFVVHNTEGTPERAALDLLCRAGIAR